MIIVMLAATMTIAMLAATAIGLHNEAMRAQHETAQPRRPFPARTRSS